jgi:hypothetical protein
MTVRVSWEVKSGGWPNHIGVVREATLSDDLGVIRSRRVTGIKVYSQEAVALTLTVKDAEKFGEQFAAALADAGTGPLGDLVSEEPSA